MNVVTYPPGASQTQARIVIDGVRGAIFEYTAGGPAGALASSWASVADTDPYGNPYPAGFNAGPGSAFSGTNWLANSTGLFFYSPVESAGNLAISISPNGGTGPFGETINAGVTTLRPGTTGYARLINQLVELEDSAGGLWDLSAIVILSTSYLSVEFAGTPACFISQNGVISARQPGTPNPETWHSMTLNAGFAAGGTTPQYRLMPDGTVRLRGAVNLTATEPASTIFFALPTGYIPSTGQDWVTHNTLSGYIPATGSLPSSVAVDTSGHLKIFVSGVSGNFVVLDGIVITL